LSDLAALSRSVLEASWRPTDGFCPPNPTVYPHQWLWDSCFHAIAWNALADDRALVELTSCFAAQLPNGFVPHMRYLTPNHDRGPAAQRSSYVQPPIYAHAAAVIARSGRVVPESLIDRIEAGLDWLWRERRDRLTGLAFIVHPWESGADDSPRWDSWIGLDSYVREQFRAVDRRLRDATEFDDDAVAVWSGEFVAAPAAFNALMSHAAFELEELRQGNGWAERGTDLAAAVDRELWDDDEGLWSDRAIVGGGPSVTIPTLDGVFGALVTPDGTRAARALQQLSDPLRYGTEFGLAYLPRRHPKFDPDAYWRGPAWPQLNYLGYVAARRCGDDALAVELARMSRAGAATSGLAEFWNPLTGEGRGAVPQGWGALAAVYPYGRP
jgi:hypothetical protein